MEPVAVASGASLAASSAIDRRFEAVMFDWDGTAVADRHCDAGDVRLLIEALCGHGMHLGVVTGTHVENVDDQLGPRPSGPGRLLLAVNRGSEIYEVRECGRPPRAPTASDRRREPRARSAAALTSSGFRHAASRPRSCRQRLNRRKIDLIPLPEWSDPPKAQIDGLLVAVEARLAAARTSPGCPRSSTSRGRRLAKRASSIHG